MIAEVYSCVCCEPKPRFPDPYSFQFGQDTLLTNSHIFQRNEIKTTKYNLFNFVPKSIISQYQRLANLYFLIVAIISTIPEATPLNPALIWTPLVIVLFISVIKQLYEDYSRYRTDREVNDRNQVEVIRDGKLQKIKWKDTVVGDICRIKEQEMFPADILLISSSDKDGIAYIETSTLDGEQTSKIRYAFQELNLLYRQDNINELRGEFQGEPPNPSLTHFRGTLAVDNYKLAIVDSNQLLFRGTKLKSTKWIFGIVIYTGQCSKIMMNGQGFVTKLSSLQKKLNYLLIVMLTTQIIACFIMTTFSTNREFSMKESQQHYIWHNFSKSKLFVMNFLTFFVEYSSCIPVSLIVSIEIAKTAQSYFIDFDQLMYSPWRKRKAYARTAALNEQLGQVQYIFCDKTGTLTKNELKFHTAIIGNQLFEFKYKSQSKSYRSEKFETAIYRKQYQSKFLEKQLILSSDSNIIEINDYSRLIEQYLMCLLVCNNISTIQNEQNEVVFQSESPDELALIELANSFDFKFLKRDKNSITVQIQQKIHKIEVISMFRFTSDRKRMSAIVKWKGLYFLYAKGADNVILERATNSPFHIVRSVDSLSRSGLRSLLVAVRLISEKQILDFKNDLELASMDERQLVMEQYSSQFQKQLTILGATGLLDELQSEVPQTLRDFQRAQIKVWMLTGDKLETAIEIGKACSLIEPEYEVILMKPSNLPISQFIGDCQNKVANSLKKYSLVVQGSVLTQIFNDQALQKQFAELTLFFTSVICCRMLPVQKSQAVRMVKKHLKKICLAVGDGGNDVSMIKEANIGIGIYGQEGMNAVQASDYALPEFKMIWRLLFVHGRWNYMRISQMILYFAYKSVLFTIPRFLFSFKDAFSGQPIYDDYYIALYNVVFTALPLLVRALFEQDVNYVTKIPESELGSSRDSEAISESQHLPIGYKINLGIRKLFPKIYFVGLKNQIFNLKQCILWISQAILMGLCLFFISQRALASESITQDGYNSNLQIVSITIYTTVIMLDTIKLCMQVRYWTKLLFFTIIFLSIAPYLAFIWILNYKFKRPVQGVLNIYFTTIKTYFSILFLVMILVLINGIMVYIRFHSHRILKKMTIALEEDNDMLQFISQKNEVGVVGVRDKVDSEGLIKLKSNYIMNEARKTSQ